MVIFKVVSIKSRDLDYAGQAEWSQLLQLF